MDSFAQKVTVFLVVGVVTVLASLSIVRYQQVHTYQDPNTGCHYLYTAGSSLVPREDGTGEHMGCFTRGGNLL